MNLLFKTFQRSIPIIIVIHQKMPSRLGTFDYESEEIKMWNDIENGPHIYTILDTADV